MRVRMAHLRDQGINFAVFDVDAASRLNNDREELLLELIAKAQANGLRVDKGALAFNHGGRTRFYGTPDLVKYLSDLGGVPNWTHEIVH